MSYADGLCAHNNLSGSCPYCLGGNMNRRQMRGMGRLNGFGSTMGANCAPGYYELKVLGIDTGQCLPSLSTDINAVSSGVTGEIAKGAATSVANQAAAAAAAQNAISTKVWNAVKAHPYITVGAVVAILAMTTYGSLKFARGS